MKSYSTLKKLNTACIKCTSCGLSKTRKNVVVGKGNQSARMVIIGEGPGEKEDITGLPFVGRAGKMLDTALASVDIDPLEDCYITNIVKCRPPDNRKPSLDESEACMPWLNEQINLLSPKIIEILRITPTFLRTPLQRYLVAIFDPWFWSHFFLYKTVELNFL